VSEPPLFPRLALIGIGLIGASIALASRRGAVAGHVAISSRTPATLRRAEALGLGDSYHADPAEAVRDADCVILSIPVGAVGPVTAAIAGVMKPGAIISDVGSVKASVVAAMRPHVPKGVHFVPAHPVAGTEYSGPDAGFAALFDNRWCILTPPDGTDPAAVEKLTTFWRRLGANVETMSPEHHDLVLAITSHVPHLIAYNIVGTAADLETVTESEVM
jgi:cyclohexadieny/prephenate dehydrogenase